MQDRCDNASDAVSEAAEGTQQARGVAARKEREELQIKLKNLQAEVEERNRKKLEELQGRLARAAAASEKRTQKCNELLEKLLGPGRG
jgi:hypothetical protein